LRLEPDIGEVTRSIRAAFERNAGIEAEGIRVTASNGAVTLEGTVSSWAERNAAVRAAWDAPGVKTVHDQLEVLQD
jgi:osmotically-inducible protein OsmY